MTFLEREQGDVSGVSPFFGDTRTSPCSLDRLKKRPVKYRRFGYSITRYNSLASAP